MSQIVANQYSSIKGSIEYTFFEYSSLSTHLVVVFHGLGGNSTSPKYLFNEPSNKAHILGISLPYHSSDPFNTPLVNAFSISNYINLCADLIESLKEQFLIKKVYVVGHSIGAQFSIQFMLNKPTISNTLILVCPAGFGKKDQLFFKVLNYSLVKAALQIPLVRNLLASFLYTPSDASRTESINRSIGLLLSHISEFELTQRKLMHLLYNVAAHVKIIWAKDDELLPFSYAAECANHFQRSSVLLLQEGKHNLLKSRPEKIIQIIQSNLD